MKLTSKALSIRLLWPARRHTHIVRWSSAADRQRDMPKPSARKCGIYRSAL